MKKLTLTMQRKITLLRKNLLELLNVEGENINSSVCCSKGKAFEKNISKDSVCNSMRFWCEIWFSFNFFLF